MNVRTSARVALVLFLLIAAMPVEAGREGGAVYLDEQGRFLFTIPEGGIVADLIDPGPTAVEFDATDPWGIFTVATDDQVSGTSLDQYAMDAAEQLRRNLSNARLLPDGLQSSTLGGEPARAFVVQGRQQGTSVDIFGIVAAHAGTVYTLLFTTRPDSYDAYLSQEQAILASFTFLT